MGTLTLRETCRNSHSRRMKTLLIVISSCLLACQSFGARHSFFGPTGGDYKPYLYSDPYKIVSLAGLISDAATPYWRPFRRQMKTHLRHTCIGTKCLAHYILPKAQLKPSALSWSR